MRHVGLVLPQVAELRQEAVLGVVLAVPRHQHRRKNCKGTKGEKPQRERLGPEGVQGRNPHIVPPSQHTRRCLRNKVAKGRSTCPSKSSFLPSHPDTAQLQPAAPHTARWEPAFTEGQGRGAKNKPQFCVSVSLAPRGAGKSLTMLTCSSSCCTCHLTNHLMACNPNPC